MLIDSCRIASPIYVVCIQFIFEADCDLINDIFRGLEDLYWKNPMKVSAAHVIGVLLSNMSDVYHYCGHTLSTESLAEVVSEALTSTAIEVWLFFMVDSHILNAFASFCDAGIRNLGLFCRSWYEMFQVWCQRAQSSHASWPFKNHNNF